MRVFSNMPGLAALAAVVLASGAAAQPLAPELKAKVDVKIKAIQAWSSDPALVAAVKAHNAALTPDEKAMTNEKWSRATVLDPVVRSYTRNAAGTFLKTKRDEQISECFVSGADGTKVGFLSKPSSWSHADKDKHRVPMSGRSWIGPIAIDDSTGLQLVQVALPVLDAGKPIGSIVVGLAVSKLK
jgi:hypothetical protein